MKPGDLVRLFQEGDPDIPYVVGSFKGEGGFEVPASSIALVIKLTRGDELGTICHVLVDGRAGWVYRDDCEVIDETR